MQLHQLASKLRAIPAQRVVYPLFGVGLRAAGLWFERSPETPNDLVYLFPPPWHPWELLFPPGPEETALTWAEKRQKVLRNPQATERWLGLMVPNVAVLDQLLQPNRLPSATERTRELLFAAAEELDFWLALDDSPVSLGTLQRTILGLDEHRAPWIWTNPEFLSLEEYIW